MNLSKRQKEILQLISHGYTKQEIANSTFISCNTVKTHTSKLLRTMNVNNKAQLVMRGFELGLLQARKQLS